MQLLASFEGQFGARDLHKTIVEAADTGFDPTSRSTSRYPRPGKRRRRARPNVCRSSARTRRQRLRHIARRELRALPAPSPQGAAVESAVTRLLGLGGFMFA